MAPAAGRARALAALGGLLAAALLQQACSGSSDGADPWAGEPLTEALAAVGPEVVLPALDDFLGELGGLEAALAGWAADPGSDAARGEAQAAFGATMIAWQVLEVMQIGPAASSLTAVGGEDIRDEIYSWPTVNPCRVDQETIDQEWDDPDWFTTNLVNSYGLDAVEHLLYAGEDNACSSQVDINEEGLWDALGDAELAARRAAFGLALVGEIQRQAEVLYEAWSPAGGDLSGGMLGGEGSPYESQQEALGAVFDALIYLETATADRKLARPLGLEDDCGAETCPEEVELLESGLSTAAIQANLAGARALLTGGGTWGLDDVLEDVGHGDLAAQILAELDAAEAAAAAVGSPLDQALSDDPEAVAALYDAVKAVTALLKGELASVLALELPDEAAGDAD